MRRRVAIAIGVLAAAGCSLFSGLDGFSGGSETTAPDGNVTDAADESPAPGDSGPASDAGARFCASRPGAHLCEDFDEAALPGAFDKTGVRNGTMRIDGAEVTSPPGALLAEIPALPSTTAHVYLEELLPAAATYVLSFAMRLDPGVDGGAAAQLVNFDLTWSGGLYQVGLDVTADGVLALHEFQEGSATKTTKSGAAPPRDAWGRYTVRVVLAGNAPRAEVVLDGAVIASRGLSVPAGASGPSVLLGPYAFRPAEPVVVRYDDVLLELE